MNVWYAFLNALGIRMFEMDFMKNALLAVLLLGPLFGLLSTMIVTGKMSFFSDALGHSGFTGIAIGVLCSRSILRSGCRFCSRCCFPLSAAGRASRRTPSSASFPPPPSRLAFSS